jgi:hypothetical protein
VLPELMQTGPKKKKKNGCDVTERNRLVHFRFVPQCCMCIVVRLKCRALALVCVLESDIVVISVVK